MKFPLTLLPRVVPIFGLLCVLPVFRSHDIVSYVVTGQPCQRGIFSSNFMAGRKGNPLSVGAWAAIKTKLKSRCNATSEKQGVCCYSPEVGQACAIILCFASRVIKPLQNMDLHARSPDSDLDAKSFSEQGGPRTCNIPWGGIGERTSHPVSRELTAAGKIKMYCESCQILVVSSPCSSSLVLGLAGGFG